MDLSFTSRKREREDDDDDNGLIHIQGVPADKKQRSANFHTNMPLFLRANPELRPPLSRSRTLPFRLEHPLPPPPPPFFEHRDDESPTDESSSNSPASFMSASAPPDPGDVEMHLDHHIAIAGSVSPPSPYFRESLLMRPTKLNSPGLDSFSGRLPTPIHAKFMLAQPPPPPRSRTDSFLPTQHVPKPFSVSSRPLQQRLENDYRMPSPIVEDSMEMTDLPSSQLSRLSVSQDSMDVDDDAVWSQPSPHAASEALPWDAMDVPPTPTTPGRMGRARSGAFSASNTPQEKGGKKMAFGYRKDCEKCRMRFPGHFAHFL